MARRRHKSVAPLVGARVEIFLRTGGLWDIESLPSWERGLKLRLALEMDDWYQSLPSWERGLKYPVLPQRKSRVHVAPLVGARVEILAVVMEQSDRLSRSPRGSAG